MWIRLLQVESRWEVVATQRPKGFHEVAHLQLHRLLGMEEMVRTAKDARGARALPMTRERAILHVRAFSRLDESETDPAGGYHVPIDLPLVMANVDARGERRRAERRGPGGSRPRQ